MLLAMYQKKEMTVLLKEHGKYCIVKKPVLSLLEEACLFYGSTLQGRTIAAKKILQIHQKVPILVSEKKETLWFPTVSATRDDCIWIHANEVVSYHAKGKRTQVIFPSKDEIELAIAYRTIQRQMRRCEQLRMYLRAHE